MGPHFGAKAMPAYAFTHLLLDKMAVILADIFERIFVNKNFRIPIKVWLKFVATSLIDNNRTSVQVMAWGRADDKPLPELMLIHWRKYAPLGGDALILLAGWYLQTKCRLNSGSSHFYTVLPLSIYVWHTDAGSLQTGQFEFCPKVCKCILNIEATFCTNLFSNGPDNRETW